MNDTNSSSSSLARLGLRRRSKTGTFASRNSGSFSQSRIVLLRAGKWVVMWSMNLSRVRGQCYKTFLSVIYGFSLKARVFVPGKPFQSSLMFVGEARNLPWSGAPRCSTPGQVPSSGSWPHPQTLD